MRFFAPFILLTLVGCSTQPTVASWLDPVTAVTITAQAQPLVLARPETRRSINGRDYVRLTALEVNRMGERRLYLIAVLWSNANLSTRQWEAFEQSFAQIEMRIDERPIVLTRHTGDVSELSIGESPLPLPFPGARQILFPIDGAELRAMAASNGIQLTTLGLPGSELRYEERKDGRRSLGEFLEQLPGAAASGERRAASDR